MKQPQLLTKLIMSVMFMFAWAAQAQETAPDTGAQFYLDSKYSMPLPASLLEIVVDEEGKESGKVSTYEDQYFAPGTKFAYTGLLVVGNYGDAENNSRMPLVFVNPIDANGVVDLSLTVGFPAHFLTGVDSNKKASENPAFKSIFNEEYQKAGTTFDAESKNLEGYLSFVSGQQDTNVYAGQTVGAQAAVAGNPPASGKPVVKRPKLGFPAAITEKSTEVPTQPMPEPKADGADVAGAATPSEDVSRKASPDVESAPVESAPVANSDSEEDIYHNDPRLKNAIQVRASEELTSVILELKNDDGTVRHVRRDLEIPAGTRFVPILWKADPKRDKTTQEMVRWFYKVDSEGNIATNEFGEREVYVLPVSKLQYKDPVDGTTRRVSETSKLYLGAASNVAEKTAPKPAPDAGADATGTSEKVTGTEKPPFKPPTRPISLTPPSKGSATMPPTAKPAPAKPNDIPANALALSECKNQAFADQLSKAGEECSLVEIENFQLVKSQLIQQLKGESQADSVLLNSSVVAIDNSTKMCSKIDITHEAYLDDSRAQAKINEYKQNMTEAYKNIVSSIHTNKSGRIGAAFVSAPKESTHTYSCDKTQTTCRYSYDHFTPERMPLVKEITMYADDLSQQEKIRVYGPSEDHKYLVVFKRGNQDVRTLVLQDNPGLVFNGPVGKLLKDMSSFESNFKYSKLSDIQNEYSSERLRDSAMGHFISAETTYPNGQKEVLKERLGSPKSLSLISKIRQDKKFYELRCRFNAFERKTSLPKWNAGSEAVN